MSRSVLDTAGRDRHTTVLQRAWQVCCTANSCTWLDGAHMPVLTLPTSDTPASALQPPLAAHAVPCRPAGGACTCAVRMCAAQHLSCTASVLHQRRGVILNVKLGRTLVTSFCPPAMNATDSPCCAGLCYDVLCCPAGGAGTGGASQTGAAAKSAAGATVAGAAALSSSSDGQAGLPLSSNPGGKQLVMWGNRTPLRKDASW